MTTFNWKILETTIANGILKAVKYRCVATDGDLSVETEDTCLWDAPVAYPDDGGFYVWDEETQSWTQVNKE